MRFHYKIILAALCFTLLVAGARALTGGGDTGPGMAQGLARGLTDDLGDPGFWMALGQGLIGAGADGWCKCS